MIILILLGLLSFQLFLKIIQNTSFLPTNITFSLPVSSSTLDVIFSRIAATTTTTTITIVSEDVSKSINVSDLEISY